MHPALELPHRDPVIRKLDRGIGGAGVVSAGLRNFRNRQRVDKLGQRTGSELSAKFGCGPARPALVQGCRYRQNSAAVKKCPPCDAQWVAPRLEWQKIRLENSGHAKRLRMPVGDKRG